MLVEVRVAVLNFYPVDELVCLTPGESDCYPFVIVALEIIKKC